MKDRPILFSAPMVRALLDGTKSQTRRVACKGTIPSRYVAATEYEPGRWRLFDAEHPSASLAQYTMPACPYGQPGDRLWVRETWAYHLHAMAASNPEVSGPWVYAADGDQALWQRLCERWRPSIHMPRTACRLVLKITSVRLERLNEISDADALAEGIDRHDVLTDGEPPPGWHRGTFEKLWERINGTESWAANPWVWVIEFRRLG